MQQAESIIKPLHADAGSGIMFNLNGMVTLGPETFPEGVIMLPVNKKTEMAVLAGGARLAGIRFHPAIGYSILGKHYHRLTLLKPDDDQDYQLYSLFRALKTQASSECHLDTLTTWASTHLDFTDIIPTSLEKSLTYISQSDAVGNVSGHVLLSQRQIERQFKLWLGMTPKYYQRIRRIKRAMEFLKRHRQANLADVAHQFGFSDQAHMTREFQAIARVTPSSLTKPT